MRMIFAIVAAYILLMLFCGSESKPQLLDRIEASSTKLCQFPFIYIGVTHTTCTTLNDPEGKLWCSTKTDIQNNHISGGNFFKHCTSADLGIAGNSGSGCKCVPFDLCCDGPPGSEGPGFDVFRQLHIKNATNCMEQGSEGPLFDVFRSDDIGSITNCLDPLCPDQLHVCCDTECPTTLPPPRTIPSNQCGIRNSNGVSINVTGFQDGQAQFGEFPWMVALLGQGNTYVGGGTLVHPRAVLTAAHKIHGRESGSLFVRIGDWDLNSTTEVIPSQNIPVEKVLLHPDFDRPTFVNDVALLILQKDAVLGASVLPICLPQPGQVFDGADCIVTGWGKDAETGRYQTILKKVSLPAVNHSECQKMLQNTPLGTNFNLHNTFNCAGGLGQDACAGYGGSPLICPNSDNPNEYVQIGVVSWGVGCGIVGNPSVFGSIPSTIDWINQSIQGDFFNSQIDVFQADVF